MSRIVFGVTSYFRERAKICPRVFNLTIEESEQSFPAAKISRTFSSVSTDRGRITEFAETSLLVE